MKKILVVNLLILTIIFQSCGPATQVTGSWKNDKASGAKIQSIMVTALTGRANARQTVENDLARALEKDGYKAVKSFDVIPPTFTQGKSPDKEALLEKIKGTDVDAILTVALIDQETENRYVPGSYGYAPMTRFGYYGRFWGYYNTWYPTLYSPGYYTEDKIYFLETNLYDAKTEELLWSGQSETYNPGSLTEFSKEFSSVVLAKMEKDGALK
ncbi:DUF4136 domain-containing protein [Parachryseolinea silvisoli]|jgi:hypothetical protein|uniref:hypothetical protein n=1 Tax=Parachryseolinea silvisoli TaxID=2873601 RepID=UPI002265C922|nr:hypothetical protein [Parachryseolinea silvisoli]MCD9014733.1 hypothetical protein [Parachryseolinea silvisoli]